MTSQYRHRRTSSATTAFPNPLEPGEIAVNTANRQIAIGDAQSGVIGAPLPAIAVRYFDVRGKYAVNDFVQNGTSIYRANKVTGPGAFVTADWNMMVGTADPQYVLKAGDVMSGMLTLPATVPSIGTHATNKTYVDTGLAGKSTIYSATSPPAGVADNSMWFETDTGLLYVRYNDGNSSQWVIACPQPDISNFVLRSGDTMSGPLGVPVTPTLPAHATSKSYVDGQLAGKSSIIASDTPPVGAIDNSLWYETDSGATYVRYNDLNGGAQWVAIADPAGLVYAAPFDAMAYSGMQVNGSMEVSQELGTGATYNWMNATKYVCDGWVALFHQITPGTTTVLAGVVDSGLTGIPKCLQLVTPVAGTTMAGTDDAAILQQRIEGYRWARLGFGEATAQPVTIGFWIYATKTGTAHVLLGCYGAAYRCYLKPFTVNVANTWEYKTLTFPPDTVTPANWLKTNGIGAEFDFCFGAGTNIKSGTINNWQTWTSQYAASNQTNFFTGNNDSVYLTGVVIVPGIDAPRADRSALIMRPYDQELITCQRYWRWESFNMVFYPSAGGQQVQQNHQFNPPMRAVPTVGAIVADPTSTNGGAATANVSASGWQQIGPQSAASYITSTTNGPCYLIGNRSSMDARL